MKDWVCAGAALAGVALLELQGLTAPVASDAVAALQPVFFGISYLRIAEAPVVPRAATTPWRWRRPRS